MAGRIRTIKPEFFQHEDLYDLEIETGLPVRLAFAGLWTQADREGRFEWRPRKLCANILPYDSVSFERVLHALTTRGFVVHYASGTRQFGAIPSWRKHQVINNRERPSEIPEPPGDQVLTDACPTPLCNAQAEQGTRNKEQGKEQVQDLGIQDPTDPSTSEPKIGPEPTHDEQGYKIYRVNGSELHGRRIASFSVVGEQATNGHEPEFYLDLATLERLAACYGLDPDDAEAEVLKAEAWLLTNPGRRKTRRGMPRFLNNWLRRHVDGNRGMPR